MFLVFVIRATRNHIPLKYRRPIKISNRIMYVDLNHHQTKVSKDLLMDFNTIMISITW